MEKSPLLPSLPEPINPEMTTSEYEEPETTLRTKMSKKVQGWEGTIYAIISGVLYTFGPMLTKYLPNSPLQLLIILNLGRFIFYIPTIIQIREFKVDRIFIMVTVVTAVFSPISVGLRFVAVKVLPLGDASVIVYSSPLFSACFARIILKERITKATVYSVVISTIGLCLVAKLPELIMSDDLGQRFGKSSHLIGCAYAMASVLMATIIAVIPRKIIHIPHVEDVGPFSALVLTTIGTTILLPFLPTASLMSLIDIECSRNAWLLLVSCVIRIPIQRFFYRALKTEEAYFIQAVILSVDILLSFVWQITIFGDPVDSYSFFGAVIVFFGGMILPFRKWVMSKAEDSPMRKRFKFIE